MLLLEKFIEWEFKDIEPYQVTKKEFIKLIDAQKWSKGPLEVFEKNWLKKKLNLYQYDIPENFKGIKEIILKDKFAGEGIINNGVAYFIEGKIVGLLLWDDKKDLDIFIVSPEHRGKGIGEKLIKYANSKHGVVYKKNLLYRPSANLLHRLAVREAIQKKKEVPKEVLQDYPEYMGL